MQHKTCTSSPIGSEPAPKTGQASPRINWPEHCLGPMRRFVQLRSRGRAQLLPAAPIG